MFWHKLFSVKNNQNMQNNKNQKLQESINYEKQKADFLDSLQPDDFRNAGSFNQAEDIIEQLNKALHRAVLNKEDSEEFIKKAAKNLFRENSFAVEKVINLSKDYLKIKFLDL